MSLRRIFFSVSTAVSIFAFAITSARADNPPGSLLQTFIKPPPTNFARFGEGVAGVGNDIVIGGENAGSAYVYDAGTGNLLQTIPSPNTAGGDAFGFSAAGSSSVAFIGAPTDSSVANRAGVAYSFDPASGNRLNTFHAPTATADAEFGFSVAASSNRLLVGGHGVDAPVYLFDSTNGNVLLTINDPAHNSNSEFGTSVAFVGSNILIGCARQSHSDPIARGNRLSI